MLLRHAEAENAVVERVRRDCAAREFFPHHVRRELDCVQTRERALPARERGAPVAAEGNFGPVGHQPRSIMSSRMRLAFSRCAYMAVAAASASPAASAAVSFLRAFSTTARTAATSSVKARR